MYFTQEDYIKIERWLNRRITGYKPADSLQNEDVLHIIQNYTNKTITAFELACFVQQAAGNYINISDISNKYCISLSEAISLVPKSNKKLGVVISFLNEGGQWVTYQFNSRTLDNWNNLSYWVNTYDNISKFKGVFLDEETLLAKVENPAIGDYAFVGESLDKAILYICQEYGVWLNTYTLALDFANKFEAINSRDFDDLDYSMDEQYSDRAEKDALGRIIHFTYVTREGLSNYVLEKILNTFPTIDIPKDSINLDNLTQSLRDYIGSGGNVVNVPDEEDLTTKDEVLKLKDKEYSPNNFSGKGRKYLRKNMIDGINVLEQDMISEPDTIYIIQYDYCLNKATINIPENSTLYFIGGSLNGGIVVCNNTCIEGTHDFSALDNTTISSDSTFVNGQIRYNKANESLEYWLDDRWYVHSFDEQQVSSITNAEIDALFEEEKEPSEGETIEEPTDNEDSESDTNITDNN